MFKVDQDYWLYLEPYIYTDYNTDEVLLYNTLDGEYIESNNQLIINLIKSLSDRNNNGVIKFKGEDFNIEIYRDFISELRDKFFGDLILINSTEKKPIQFVPIINLQTEVDKLLNENERSVGEDLLKYLKHISIIINGDCNNNCKYCNFFYLQSDCCNKKNDNLEIKISLIKNIFEQIEHAPLNSLNIIGGNLSKYSSIKELLDLLKSKSEIVKFSHHYKNWNKNGTELFSGFTNDVFITYPIDYSSLNFLNYLKNENLINIHFLITNISQYPETESVIKKYAINKFKITPIFTKHNNELFKDYVFLNKEDILNSKVSQKKIFANQKLNSNFFGSLIISNNGDVSVSQNTIKIGNLKNESILQCIYKELLNNSAWRLIRNKSKCKNCLYKYLCPSPSNYELLFDRFNLCTIH